eukprot:gene691-2124_t
MSYTSYFTNKAFAVPSGSIYLAAGLVYCNFMWRDAPAFGMKEISSAEYKATPVEYLQNPDHHHKRFPKVPGEATTDGSPHTSSSKVYQLGKEESAEEAVRYRGSAIPPEIFAGALAYKGDECQGGSTDRMPVSREEAGTSGGGVSRET